MTNKINVGLTTGHIKTLEQYLGVCHIYLTTGKVTSIFSDEDLDAVLSEAAEENYITTFLDELADNLHKYNRTRNTNIQGNLASEANDRSIKYHAFRSESEERSLHTITQILSEIEDMSDEFKATELYRFAHENLIEALTGINLDIPLPTMIDDETARRSQLNYLMQDMQLNLEILDSLGAKDVLIDILRKEIEEAFARDFPNGIDPEFAYPTAEEIAEILKEKDLGLDY